MKAPGMMSLSYQLRHHFTFYHINPVLRTYRNVSVSSLLEQHWNTYGMTRSTLKIRTCLMVTTFLLMNGQKFTIVSMKVGLVNYLYLFGFMFSVVPLRGEKIIKILGNKIILSIIVSTLTASLYKINRVLSEKKTMYTNVLHVVPTMVPNNCAYTACM